MHFMEDIIGGMAGCVPLAAIAERILSEFAADQLGDFKGSLVGLLAAYNYELSILQVYYPTRECACRNGEMDAFENLLNVWHCFGITCGLLSDWNIQHSHDTALQAANRLMSSDAFRILFAIYRSYTQTTRNTANAVASLPSSSAAGSHAQDQNAASELQGHSAAPEVLRNLYIVCL